MKKETIKKPEKRGWKVGPATDFPALSREEEEYVEMKLVLSNYFQELRKKKNMTQAQVAEKIKSSQSRVAKIERAESSVSLDLIVRSVIALGSSKKEIGRIMLAKTAYGRPAGSRLEGYMRLRGPVFRLPEGGGRR